jgi:hypothetical protein
MNTEFKIKLVISSRWLNTQASVPEWSKRFHSRLNVFVIMKLKLMILITCPLGLGVLFHLRVEEVPGSIPEVDQSSQT